MITKSVSIMKCAWVGMLGFAIGGVIAYSLGDAMILGFILQGALGGGFLGLATRSYRQALFIALLSGGAYFVGILVSFFIVIVIWEPSFSTLFVGCLSGTVLGAALGFRSARLRGAIIGAVAGALGFGLGLFLSIGNLSMSSLPSEWAFKSILLNGGVQGVIGGLFLGMAWGYCERLSTTHQVDS